MTIGVLVNTRKALARATLLELCEVLERRKIELVIESASASLVGREGRDDFFSGVDVVVSIGGDGTMLETVRRIGEMGGSCDVPVAAINIGMLGFLTTCQENEMEALADVFEAKSFEVSERMMLEVEFEENNQRKCRMVLNEVVLARCESGRLVSLDARVNGEILNHYRADGLIVSTPTGSTAYSLSAGGPLMSPRSRALVVTPICPHSLSNRSVVVEDDCEVQLLSSGDGDLLQLTLDGHDTARIPEGTVVKVRRAEQSLRLVRMPGHSFYETLRKKLNWG